MTSETFEMIAHGLFTSTLSYCLPVFGNVWFQGEDIRSKSFTKEDCRKIQVLQNKLARLKTRLPRSTPTETLLQQSNDLSIHQLIALHSLLLTYKIIKSNRPYYIAKKLKLRVPTEDQVFPQRQAYTLPMSGSLSTTRSGFCYRAAKLFNSLPLNLRKCCSEKTFKTEVEKWAKENIKIKPP